MALLWLRLSPRHLASLSCHLRPCHLIRLMQHIRRSSWSAWQQYTRSSNPSGMQGRSCIHSLSDTVQHISHRRMRCPGQKNGVYGYAGQYMSLQVLSTFLVPMNNACSTACAMPGISSSSEKLPTLTLRLALALSVSGSWTSSASNLLGNAMTRYDLSSRAGFSKSSVTRWNGVIMLAKLRFCIFTFGVKLRKVLVWETRRQERMTLVGQ